MVTTQGEEAVFISGALLPFLQASISLLTCSEWREMGDLWQGHLPCTTLLHMACGPSPRNEDYNAVWSFCPE